MMSKSEDLAKILNVFSLFSSPTAPWACCEGHPTNAEMSDDTG